MNVMIIMTIILINKTYYGCITFMLHFVKIKTDKNTFYVGRRDILFKEEKQF